MGLTSHIAASEYGGVAIGEYATIDPYLYSDVEVGGVEGGENIAIGFFATSLGWRDVAIGAYAEAGKVSATAIGFAATAKNEHSLVVGRGKVGKPSLEAQAMTTYILQTDIVTGFMICLSVSVIKKNYIRFMNSSL
jgi:hypothetical protein